MKLELKNIKHLASMSEETHCYTGTLYLDGKPVANVGNRGHGGADDAKAHPKSGLSQSETYAKIREIDEWFKTQDPVGEYGECKPMYNTVEMWCCEAVNEFLARKDLRSLMNRKVVLHKDGKIYTIKGKYTPERLDPIKKANVGFDVLNSLDFEEALKLYKAAQA